MRNRPNMRWKNIRQKKMMRNTKVNRNQSQVNQKFIQRTKK